VTFNLGHNKNPSIARTSDISQYPNEFLVSSLFERRTTIMPKPKDHSYKLKTYSKSKTTKKKAMLPTISEEE